MSGKVWPRGKRHKPESNEKNRLSHLGVRHTEDAKCRISEAQSGAKNWNWKGGKALSKEGYMMIKTVIGSNRYELEHRLIIESLIGRKLQPFEKVHHLNGIKGENVATNLMAFTSESAHQRFHSGGVVLAEEIIFDGRKYLLYV